MANNSEKHGMRGIAKLGMTADSTNSRQGSEPLSDPYVAVKVNKGRMKRASYQMKAPEGAGQLDIWHSAHIASTRSKSALVTPPGPALINTPPGIKPSVGYKYQALLSVSENSMEVSRQLGRPMDAFGNAGGSWDTAMTQANLKVSMAVTMGCKQSATSEAPGSFDCG